MPVIITDVPESAQLIEKYGAGVCIPYKKEAFEKALLKLLQNNTTYTTYRKNAIKLSHQFDTNSLIQKALAAI